MSERSPDELGDRFQSVEDELLVLNIRHEKEYDDWHVSGSVKLDRPDDALVLPAHDPGSLEPPVTVTLVDVKERNEGLGRDREKFVHEVASDIPNHPPNFERIKRTNVRQESVPADEPAELELGPNNCVAA
nr:hypothetical protein [Natrinema gelatinilyticum]